ncbi:MAG: hypothetical protein CSYNP_04327 [Syntrophus sp. SKADARSKE-3]|nr:hypothetical protein [Syntrophus sp. SKADARSKE-3]
MRPVAAELFATPFLSVMPDSDNIMRLTLCRQSEQLPFYLILPERKRSEYGMDIVSSTRNEHHFLLTANIGTMSRIL